VFDIGGQDDGRESGQEGVQMGDVSQSGEDKRFMSPDDGAQALDGKSRENSDGVNAGDAESGEGKGGYVVPW